MELNLFDSDAADFDAHTYLRMLIAIAKADPENGPPEFDFVRRQARNFRLDYDGYLASTDKGFSIEKQRVSRRTALTILKDAILLASLDGNFSLPEKQRVYTYAEKLNVPRADVDALETLIDDFRTLHHRWQKLVISV
jgi:tellurite resistance protein